MPARLSKAAPSGGRVPEAAIQHTCEGIMDARETGRRTPMDASARTEPPQDTPARKGAWGGLRSVGF